MAHNKKIFGLALASMLTATVSMQVFAHGDVTPQGVETDGLEPLGEEWVDENPYRKPYANNDLAVTIGDSAYNQNCARCHGLEAISGGIAPDLRELESDFDGDEWYQYRVRNGAVRDGAVYMPKMADYLSQEALWAIRTYIESRREAQ
jgi:cytochrome c-550 PedF